MSAPVGPATRHAEFAALMRAAAAGDYRPAYLLAGEPHETRAAAQALIDTLVPESRRAFNLEVYDGRTTPLATVLDSLRTPGFFAGTKVIWVRESPLFLSGEKRGDIAAAMFTAWSEGREQDATEKLLTVVGMAGWPQEQFCAARWSRAPKTRIREVFGADVNAEQLAQLDAMQAVCVARDLRVSGYRDDSGAFLEFLDRGMPPGTVVVFTAAAVDARKRIVKRLADLGGFISLVTARERSGALSRESIDDLVARSVQTFGKKLAPAAHQLIIRRAGTDSAMLAMELEKLCLYVGERPTITEDDVRSALRDMAESWIFDFTGALTGRQIARALPLLHGLLEQGEPPLRLLAMIAREIRMLLLARESIDADLGGKWRADLQFNAFQAHVLPRIGAETRRAFGNSHPFVLYRRFQDAAHTAARELRDTLVRLADLDWRLKSSRGDPALLLEAFVIHWCRGKGSRDQGAKGWRGSRSPEPPIP
jgi:DNA polymerase-3 subunit delta